jgi:hypothetical protein
MKPLIIDFSLEVLPTGIYIKHMNVSLFLDIDGINFLGKVFIKLFNIFRSIKSLFCFDFKPIQKNWKSNNSRL